MVDIPEQYLEWLDNIQEDSSNPNFMSPKQLSALKESMVKYGAIVPIIINQDNLIIDGHQRKKIAEELGLKKYPCIKINANEIDAKLLKQIMNKLKGVHNYDLDLEEYRVILEEQGNLDSLNELVAFQEEDITRILEQLGKIDPEEKEEKEEETPRPQNTAVLKFKTREELELAIDSLEAIKVKYNAKLDIRI